MFPPNSQKGMKADGDNFPSLSMMCTGWLLIFLNTSEKVFGVSIEFDSNVRSEIFYQRLGD